MISLNFFEIIDIFINHIWQQFKRRKRASTSTASRDLLLIRSTNSLRNKLLSCSEPDRDADSAEVFHVPSRNQT